MAQRPYWYAESLSESSTTSTSFVNKLTTSITPNASKAVAVFFFCEVSQSNGSSGAYARLTIGGVEKCFGSFVTKEVSSPRDYNPVSGFAIIPASGSPSAQTINIDYCPESGVTGYIRNVRIVAIELGANDYYDEESSRQTRTGSTTLVNVSGLGITPASGSYIVFASSQSDMNSDTDGAQVAITSDGATGTEPYISSVRDNVGFGTTYPIQRLNAWNRTASGNGDGACSGSETLSVGFAPNTASSTMGIQNVRILALNTADFDNVYVNVLTSDSTGTQTSYQDALTLTASTPAANPHLSMAVWSHEGSSTSVSTYTQFNDDGDVLNERIREAYVTTNDRGDNTGGSGRIEDWTTSSRTLKLQRRSETSSATARLKRGAVIVAFDLGSAGGGGYTLSADSGSFSMTGSAAVLRRTRIMPANAGSYALSGQTATLRHGFVLGGGVGSYTLGGQSAFLKATRKITANAGNYALSGQAANLERSILVAASSGSYAINGGDAQLEKGFKLIGGAGAYVLNGQDADLIYGQNVSYTLDADSGVFNLSGQGAGLIAARRVAALVGAYNLTGQAAGLKTSKSLSAMAASFTLSGQAATLKRLARLTASSGSYSLTGQAASLELARMLAAQAGSYILTGDSAILRKGIKLQATPGSYALNGQNALLYKGLKFLVDAGVYATTPGQAYLRRGIIMPAEGGVYVLQGQDVLFLIIRWEPTDPAGGVWDPSAEPSGEWAVVAVSGGDWSEVGASSGDWFDVPSASGSWQ